MFMQKNSNSKKNYLAYVLRLWAKLYIVYVNECECQREENLVRIETTLGWKEFEELKKGLLGALHFLT